MLRLCVWSLTGLVVCALTACGSFGGRSRDLHKNSRYYRSPGYVSTLPGDLAAFVLPVRDKRHEVANLADASEQNVYVQWMPEGIWERSPAQMVDSILRDEIRDSQVFASLLDVATPGCLVMEPTLMSFRAGQQPSTSGRRSVADCSLRVVVHGPASSDGQRSVLLDRVFVGQMATPILFQPPPLAATIGEAVRRTMQSTLTGLDRSNVARTGVPLELDLASNEDESSDATQAAPLAPLFGRPKR